MESADETKVNLADCEIEANGHDEIGSDIEPAQPRAESGFAMRDEAAEHRSKAGVGRFVFSGGVTCQHSKRNSARTGDLAVNSTFGIRGATLS